MTTVTVFEDVYASGKEETNHTFDSLVELISRPQIHFEKSAMPLLKLARFGDNRNAKGSLRYDSNVVAVSGAEVDYDDGPVTMIEAAKKLEAQGVKALLYGTPSSTPENPRWRVLLPFSREYTEDMKSHRDIALKRVERVLGCPIARESYAMSQSFYFGGVLDKKYEYRILSGDCIDTMDIPIVEAVKERPRPTPLRDFIETSSNEVHEILSYISPDCDYLEWVEVGMGLHDKFGGSEEGLALWDSWSAGGSKYKQGECARKYRGFSGTGVSFGTVANMARQSGADLSGIAKGHKTGGNQQQPPEDNKGKQADEAPKQPHPFSIFMDALTDEVEAPDFLIDNTVAAATVCFAGERGLGKTSLLVPLMFACTGLLEGYPLTASIRRKVVYVAEDTAQVQRVIASMNAAGLIKADKAEVNEWFKVVNARRLTPLEIVGVVPDLDPLWTPNAKADHTTYLAPPAVVLDTTNATISLDNISDNAEVSDAVSVLRQYFGPIPLVLIGHVAKASRSDAKQISFIGAGSWEGDTQQAIYLVSEGDERYMVLGKRRFEPEVSEYRVVSHVNAFEAVDKLGRIVEVRCFYGIPEASSVELKDAAKEKAAAEQKAKTWSAVKKRVLEYVTANPSAGKRDILNNVSGNKQQKSDAIEALVETGEITTKRDGLKTTHTKGTLGNTNDYQNFD